MTILLTIASFGTRCYAIDRADKVIWDEVTHQENVFLIKK
jgi:dolichyl-phosphate-mannose--protein O-mannosyl transferase